ncbi:MAG: hypothetical protein KDK70_08350 [Myxococcales bacterium]|nr:hypothetical protein [Myxococcales bacterium]
MIDLAWGWMRGWMRGRWLALLLGLGAAACSDDGLSPELAGDGLGGSTTGDGTATSSVNTSATVTASATEGESGAPPDGDGSTGEYDETGGGTSTGGGGSEGESEDGVGTTTGGDEPLCVASDDCACDPSEVACEVVPPACPPGTVPEVDPTGRCWTFECVPPDHCLTVPDCTACGDALACVAHGDMAGVTLACEPIPPACMDEPSCGCMPDACPLGYECVGELPGGDADLGCSCVVC